MMRVFRLIKTVDKVLREEQCGFRKGKGHVDQIFSIRLIVEKHFVQVPSILGVTGYKQALDLADRKALAKVLYVCYSK